MPQLTLHATENHIHLDKYQFSNPFGFWEAKSPHVG